MVRNCRGHWVFANGDRVFLRNNGLGDTANTGKTMVQIAEAYATCLCAHFLSVGGPGLLPARRRISTLASRLRSSWARASEVDTTIRRAWLRGISAGISRQPADHLQKCRLPGAWRPPTTCSARPARWNSDRAHSARHAARQAHLSEQRRFEIDRFAGWRSQQRNCRDTGVERDSTHRTAKDLLDRELIVGGIAGVDPENDTEDLQFLLEQSSRLSPDTIARLRSLSRSNGARSRALQIFRGRAEVVDRIG